MSADTQSANSKGKSEPGSNPNRDNAIPRKGVRPKTKNSSSPANNQMRLNWIDPLPQVDSIYPLGLDANPEAIPAGEIDLRFDLPGDIAEPFGSTIESVGDRIQLVDDDKEKCKDALLSLSYFKAARQLYSTMRDHEKAQNQPLKAVYYDETPIPLHLAGALGIIGHMDTKVGQVLIRDAGILFKRWIAKGLQINDPKHFKGKPESLIWYDKEGLSLLQRLAREKINNIVKETYTIDVDGQTYTVSMPQLVNQSLDDYLAQVNNNVPQADTLRELIRALQMDVRQWKDDDIPNGGDRDDIHAALGLTPGDGPFAISAMRDAFEEFVADYTTDIKWRVESIFKVGPPPAGTTGYGAQTVSSNGNTARWQFPLSDADVNIGYLFSPNQYFSLNPRLVGYSRRDKRSAAAGFAQQDGKAFMN